MVLGLALIAYAIVQRIHAGDPVAPTAAAAVSASAVTTPTLANAGIGEGFGPKRGGRRALRGFGEVKATITAGNGSTCEVCLLAAVTDEQRSRGLMEVTDTTLGGYDGMVFVYDQPVDGSFWMRNTPMPLSIAYFGVTGQLVSSTDMAPCEDSPHCRSYPAAAPFAYALEVPQGKLAEVGVTGNPVTITIDADHCPLAKDLKGHQP